jgi:hypothetical protein
MTPREYYRESEAARERWQDERTRDVASAWHVASFCLQGFHGRFPSLETVLDRASVVKQKVSRGQMLWLGEHLGVAARPISAAAQAALLRLGERGGR